MKRQTEFSGYVLLLLRRLFELLLLSFSSPSLSSCEYDVCVIADHTAGYILTLSSLYVYLNSIDAQKCVG